jgi:hypothetical protein
LPIAALSAISGGMGRAGTIRRGDATKGRARVVTGLVAALVAGCAGGAPSPDEALKVLEQAVQARDGGRLYDALDLDTRWSWMSIQRAERESYDIILSNFPAGADRERQLRRCEAGALAENARDLFAQRLEDTTWAELGAALAHASAPVVSSDGAQAEVDGNGHRLIFRRPAKGRYGWGFAGLSDRAEEIKRRAMADLELVRTSAADYERAATRQRP